MVEGERVTALKEIQLRLGVPQHVLIHLCEKGVVSPDFSDTRGRGKRREFSERNVFEFAVALALRGSEVPVSTVALVVRILRSFARLVVKEVPGFETPQALLVGATAMSLYLDDGKHLILFAKSKALAGPLYLRATIPAKASASSTPRVQKLTTLPTDYDTRLEVNLTRIARRIFK